MQISYEEHWNNCSCLLFPVVSGKITDASALSYLTLCHYLHDIMTNTAVLFAGNSFGQQDQQQVRESIKAWN